jgi:hypothetical protein
MSATRLLSIHKTLGAAIRSSRSSGGTVKEGVPGTTRERPWGVIAPTVNKGNTSSKSGL